MDRPVEDIELKIIFNPEGGQVNERSVVISAGLEITLTGEDSTAIIEDIKKNLTTEQLEAALGESCAEAFVFLFGIPAVECSTTH